MAVRKSPPEPLTQRTSTGSAPYPPSPLIKGLTWSSKETIIRRANGSDNWPLTWADDDNLYTAYGDGNGFEPFVPEKLSLGLAKIIGAPLEFKGINVRTLALEQKGEGKSGKKASGILMVDGVTTASRCAKRPSPCVEVERCT